jgi:uncharacterized protein (TIGR02172 family)
METALGTPLAQGRTAEVFAWDEDHVLKLFRPGWGVDVARHEAELARAIYDAGAPAPRVGDVVEVGARAGVIYERIDGPSLLTELARHPAHLRSVMHTLAETHAELHKRTVADLQLPRLREMLAQRATSVARLTQTQRRAVLRTLETLPEADALCHGDFHPDNVLLSPHGPLVIDWENAALGDPLADVARTLLLFRAHFCHVQPPARRALTRGALHYLSRLYLRRYRLLRPFAMAHLRAWELPVTAARLSEGVEPEEVYLLERVRRLLEIPVYRVPAKPPANGVNRTEPNGTDGGV